MPLAAIYILQRGEDVQPRITPLHPVAALQQTVKHISFTSHPIMYAEFQMLGRLVHTIPVRQLSFPSDLTQLEGLCCSLEADLATTSRGACCA